MAGYRAIHVRAGEPYAHVVTFVDDLTGNPLNTSGWTVTAQIREHAHPDAPLVASFAVDASILLSASTVTLSLDTAESDDVARRFDREHPGAWDVQVTVAGVPQTYLAGPVTAEGDTTRP